MSDSDLGPKCRLCGHYALSHETVCCFGAWNCSCRAKDFLPSNENDRKRALAEEDLRAIANTFFNEPVEADIRTVLTALRRMVPQKHTCSHPFCQAVRRLRVAFEVEVSCAGKLAETWLRDHDGS